MPNDAYDKLRFETQRVVDAAILTDETNRIGGHGYAHGDRRNVMQPTVEERVAYLRACYTDNLQLPDGPYFESLRELPSRILQDALNIQESIFDLNDGTHSVADFVEHLTNLPYIESPDKGASR